MELKVISSEEFFGKYLASDIDTNYFPFIKFRFVFVACVIYLLIYLLFTPLSSDNPNSNCNYSQSKCLKTFMFIHNMALCIFSAFCFINTAPVAWELFNHKEGWLYACREGWNDKVKWNVFC